MKQLSKIQFFAFILFLSLSSVGQTPADKIAGLYWSPKKDAKIEIYKKEEHYFGKSIWFAAPHKDGKNPNENLRKREVFGIELLTNFSYSRGAYTDGEIYDPESSKTYDCKMSLNGNNLRVRGYIGISIFSRTEIFERIN